MVEKSWKVSFCLKEGYFIFVVVRGGSSLRDLCYVERKSLYSLCLCSGSHDTWFFGEQVGNGCLKPITSWVLSSNPVCGEYLHGQSPSLHAHGILSLGSQVHIAERQREGLGSLHFSLMSYFWYCLALASWYPRPQFTWLTRIKS